MFLVITAPEIHNDEAALHFSFGLGAGEIGNKTSNPLKQVLNAVGEKVECVSYDRVCFNLATPFQMTGEQCMFVPSNCLHSVMHKIMVSSIFCKAG